MLTQICECPVPQVFSVHWKLSSCFSTLVTLKPNLQNGFGAGQVIISTNSNLPIDTVVIGKTGLGYGFYRESKPLSNFEFVFLRD